MSDHHPYASKSQPWKIGGYSLVELMVVVAILGTLAAIAIPSYRKMSERAKYQATMNQLLGIQTIIMGSRVMDRKTLIQLTGSGCMYCSQGFSLGADLTDFVPAWNPAIASAWSKMGYESHPYDAWKLPIALDENELEFGSSDCRHDTIWSAGPNAIFEGGDDSQTGGRGAYGDDVFVSIPFYAQTLTNCPNGW